MFSIFWNTFLIMPEDNVYRFCITENVAGEKWFLLLGTTNYFIHITGSGTNWCA
jgi:hypothetical protein